MLLLTRMWNFLVAFVTGWKNHESQSNGVLAPGDPTVPPSTHWLHILYLRFFVWKKITVFEVPRIDALVGYRFGYRAADGTTKLKTKLLNNEQLGSFNGREDCTFFAEDRFGREVPLTIKTQIVKGGDTYKELLKGSKDRPKLRLV
jgi:hypothetical protein